MRLDKFLSHATPLSREEARRSIRSNQVSVNGQIITDASFKPDTDATVMLAGQALTLPGKRYFMLHKPAGYVCATHDSDHPTVLDLLPPELNQDLRIAGRLDIDTTGLVLLSNDGQWLHRISSPRQACQKTYLVTLSQPVTQETLQQLETGILLRGESKPTRPAQAQLLAENRVELSISEGRYHQVKRMFAACGNRVTALHRSQIAGICLPSTLQAGEFRALTASEITMMDKNHAH
ncbi:MAG: 16S rRNA pseudouridine(516) synthase RsuA [Pseudomonadales bacterium]|nr:16S rRNA pseudouridine(516) synthase RsuA [Pseudomonadales bacterium]